MTKYLLLYRVPRDYRPTPDTANAWETWFGTMGDTRIDAGHGVLESRALGNVGSDTRLGGYTIVEAENIEAAAALASGAPSIAYGGGVEVGAIPDLPLQTRTSTGP